MKLSILFNCLCLISILFFITGEVQRNIQEGVGALKISIQYSAGVLSVLILHAKSLPLTPQGVPPSPYVKVNILH